MTDNTNGNILTTESKQTLVCKTPDQVESKIITIHEWNAIKNGVQKRVSKKTFFKSFCWKDLGMAFLGIGITTLISVFIAGFSSFNKTQLITLISIAALFIIFSVILIIIDFQFNEKDNEISNGIIETMGLIEKNRF